MFMTKLVKLNLTSIGASAASGVPFVSNAIGNGLETSFDFDGDRTFKYKGIGSQEANYSTMAAKTAIGTILGAGGAKN